MTARREIDERDIDQLLAALSDHQIAELFGLTEFEVFELRRQRRQQRQREVEQQARRNQSKTSDK